MEEIKRRKNQMTTESFIYKAKLSNNDLDYSKVIYVNLNTKIILICKEHGEFKIFPRSLYMTGVKCKLCSYKKLATTQENFIKRANIIHNNIYDYSKISYINENSKLKIRCEKHGIFNQLAKTHLKGSGCPKCANEFVESKEVVKISTILKNNNINFKKEYKYKDCKNINSLPFDFYLPDYNILIEYDGKQHFKESSLFGGYRGLLKTRSNDMIKNQYCDDNNIKLLRINYKQNVKEEINKILKEL